MVKARLGYIIDYLVKVWQDGEYNNFILSVVYILKIDRVVGRFKKWL